jgi:proteasome alpha subunit
LFETDPSGALVAYKAGSIGAGKNAIMDVFEEEYKEDLSMDEAILLGLKALTKATEEALNTKAVEIGLVKVGEKFRRLTEAEVEAYVKKLAT